jgi:hypothetical protein
MSVHPRRHFNFLAIILKLNHQMQQNTNPKRNKRCIITKVFETTQNAPDLQRLANLNDEQIRKIRDSGKTIEGGQFADGGSGQFVLIDAGNGRELLLILNQGILDACIIESNPMVPFEGLFDFFEKNPIA